MRLWKKKSNADKAIPLYLDNIKQVDSVQTFIRANLKYDISKLRNIHTDDLTEILYQKTIDLYPFAAVEKIIFRGCDEALNPLWIPIAPGTQLTKIEGE